MATTALQRKEEMTTKVMKARGLRCAEPAGQRLPRIVIKHIAGEEDLHLGIDENIGGRTLSKVLQLRINERYQK